ncbi:MAG: ABC transporter substrate-binding protein [Hyphomicrobiales bacterium]|nr:MAG: ABC transporter substrate-binding protein [Hyphomicrobiales bacterium]
MRRHTPEHRRGLSRRAVLGAAMMFAAAPAMAADHPSIAYMKQFAKEMLNAHRQGTVGSFRKVIERHADVAAIADYSLGQYRKKLPAGQKQRYYGGVVTFMSRYFADQSRIYPIAKYEIGDAAADDGEVVINSKVYLLSGQSYTVVWRLSKNGSRYKVRDAKVLGFSMVYMQRGLFTSFISKRNGDVEQLVAALTR